jgi:hypothetical protein
MAIKIPFNIGFDHTDGTRQLHLSFTAEFQRMQQPQRLKTYKDYIEHLIAQAQLAEDENSQKGIITVLQIAEQLFPHLQAEQVPLEQTIIIEMGDDAEGSTLDELLRQ